MNRWKTIVLDSRPNPCGFVSHHTDACFSVYSIACVVCGTETADSTAFGQGRCR
jgi:hypothetical protein